MKQLSLLSLRARFLLGIVFCVGLTLLLLTGWHVWAGQRTEQALLNEVMRTHLAVYESHFARSGTTEETSGKITAYREASPRLPRELAALAPGCHLSVSYDGKPHQVLVAKIPSGLVYISYDLTDHERRIGLAWAWLMLILGVTLVIVAVTAMWVSRSIIAPVTALAGRLSNIDPKQRNERLGPDFTRHELAPIAASVDRFLERLDGFVEREQSFTSTASHELRTPLAVIQGASEILSEQTRERPAATKALARIQRAAGEMSEFIHALLMLSRESQPDTEPGEACDVGEILPRIAEEQSELLNGRTVSIDCKCSESLRVQAPRSLVTIVVGNLFRNALAHTEHGSVTCEIRERTLSIRDCGPGIAAEHMRQVFDRNFTTRPGGYGMGLYLSKRICDRYGWQLALQSSPGGTTASVTF
jgi:signal transduction histidine kinase